MRVIRSIVEMQGLSEAGRRAGTRIALVPTMGYFHEGHLCLMREGRRQADLLVVSLYVNPTQFAPTEDFAAYPRDLERDRSFAEQERVDVLFVPDSREMYPTGYQTYVSVEEVTNNLCGLSRPRFFRGVTTVCMKLFHIVRPHITIFGRKDYQQYLTIKKMVRDMDMDIEVIGLPTVREADGLAMSSRNVYLSAGQREAALSLSRSLVMAERMFQAGEHDARRITGEVKAFIKGHRDTKIDYVQICDAMTMADVDRIEGPAVLALAVWVGNTRLIDNHLLGEPLTL